MRMKMMTIFAYTCRHDEKLKVGKAKGGDEVGQKGSQGEKRVCGEGQQSRLGVRTLRSLFLLGFTRTPVIVNVFRIISIELIVPPKYSGQQNPNKRADTRAETWKQSVMILSYY